MSDEQKPLEQINPQVNAEAEFYEIVNDFGDPREIIREAISNSFDAGASELSVAFEVEEVSGYPALVITIEDNGRGMDREVLARDFWGLGYSTSRGKKETIGEKGHGTKIFLRSQKVEVFTQTESSAHYSICDRPFESLARKQMHAPGIREIPRTSQGTGTRIIVTGYNQNERSKFRQEMLEDYVRWFTKVGSVENVFGRERHADFKLKLKGVGEEDFVTIPFGHVFPPESDDINTLFDEKGESAADHYVRRFVWKSQQLERYPDVRVDIVISVEGDLVKKAYNPMLRDRNRSDTGRYRVQDRYGLWLCKDYIPVTQVNSWVSTFGTGPNSVALLHGFINCQQLKLTANRGDIANTDPNVLEELKRFIQQRVEEVDRELVQGGIYALRTMQEEARSVQMEKAEFERRRKLIQKKKTAVLGDKLLIEPTNEAEVFGLLISLYTLHPDLFHFEPIDYNTQRGIDIVARNRTGNQILDGEFSYVELKFALQRSAFNHAFRFLRWIVCWDFGRGVDPGVDLEGTDKEKRRLVVSKGNDGRTRYFLDSPTHAHKIEVIRLRELLRDQLGIEFRVPAA